MWLYLLTTTVQSSLQLEFGCLFFLLTFLVKNHIVTPRLDLSSLFLSVCYCHFWCCIYSLTHCPRCFWATSSFNTLLLLSCPDYRVATWSLSLLTLAHLCSVEADCLACHNFSYSWCCAELTHALFNLRNFLIVCHALYGFQFEISKHSLISIYARRWVRINFSQ